MEKELINFEEMVEFIESNIDWYFDKSLMDNLMTEVYELDNNCCLTYSIRGVEFDIQKQIFIYEEDEEEIIEAKYNIYKH